MTITITSSAPASASHGSSLCGGSITLITPSGSTGGGSNTIASITGLQVALDGKLNDVLGAVGTNVSATGLDLNLLSGLAGYGATTADFEKLADINAATAAEIDFLAGATSNIQAQIDSAFLPVDFTAADQIIVSSAVGVADVQSLGDVLVGTVGIGYTFADLAAPTATLNANTQLISNVVDPVDPQDAATKNYVDTIVGGGVGFLPLTGGVMTGAIDMDSQLLILDADGDTRFGAAVDDLVTLDVAGNTYTWSATAMSIGGKPIQDVTDPTLAQDAATKNYVDTTALLTSGGTMTGTLDLDGQTLLLDSDGDTTLAASTDDVVVLTLGTGGVITASTDLNVGGLDISNLPAVPATASSAITQGYADLTYLQVDGSNSLTGDLDMGGNNILNVADPTLGTQIGDRDYNDARYAQTANNLSDLADASAARTNLGLATVAATGDYNDLINTPTFITNLDDLADVITGGPGLAEDGHVLTWNNAGSNYGLTPVPVTSVFGRTGDVVAVAGDYTASQITTTAAGNLVATNAQTALDELDTEKLARDGSQAMLGDLDLGGNTIVNAVAPMAISNHQFNAGSYESGLGGAGPYINLSNLPTAATPTYSFISGTDTGMRWDGGAMAFSVGGNDELVLDGSTISAESNRITNVDDPTDAADAVTLGYLEGLATVRVLGTTNVDLLNGVAGSVTAVYTLAAGVRHVVTKIIVVSTGYVPGISPVDPTISIGIGGPDYDQIVSTATLSWGPPGAADQAIYLDPEPGAVTPNAVETVSIQLDTPAAGTFTTLTADVFILGFEL